MRGRAVRAISWVCARLAPGGELTGCVPRVAHLLCGAFQCQAKFNQRDDHLAQKLVAFLLLALDCRVPSRHVQLGPIVHASPLGGAGGADEASEGVDAMVGATRPNGTLASASWFAKTLNAKVSLKMGSTMSTVLGCVCIVVCKSSSGRMWSAWGRPRCLAQGRRCGRPLRQRACGGPSRCGHRPYNVDVGGRDDGVVAVDQVARGNDADGQQQLLRGVGEIWACEDDFGLDGTEESLGARAAVRRGRQVLPHQ